MARLEEGSLVLLPSVVVCQAIGKIQYNNTEWQAEGVGILLKKCCCMRAFESHEEELV